MNEEVPLVFRVSSEIGEFTWTPKERHLHRDKNHVLDPQQFCELVFSCLCDAVMQAERELRAVGSLIQEPSEKSEQARLKDWVADFAREKSLGRLKNLGLDAQVKRGEKKGTSWSQKYWEKVKSDNIFEMEVIQAMQRHKPGTRITQETIAEKLGIDVRSLRRRLTKDDCTASKTLAKLKTKALKLKQRGEE